MPTSFPAVTTKAVPRSEFCIASITEARLEVDSTTSGVCSTTSIRVIVTNADSRSWGPGCSSSSTRSVSSLSRDILGPRIEVRPPISPKHRSPNHSSENPTIPQGGSRSAIFIGRCASSDRNQRKRSRPSTTHQVSEQLSDNNDENRQRFGKLSDL